MSDHWMDRVFRSKLGDQSAPIRDEMWAAIEARLPDAGRGNRRLVYWLFGAAVLAAVIAGVVLTTIDESGALPGMAESPQMQDARVDNVSGTSALTEQGATDLGAIRAEDNALQDNASAQEESTADKSTGTVGLAPSQPHTKNTTAVELESTNRSGHAQQSSIGFAALQNAGNRALDDQSRDDPDAALTRSSVGTAEELLERRTALNLAPLRSHVSSLEASEMHVATTDCFEFSGKGPGNFFVEFYTGPTYENRTLSSRQEDVGEYIAKRDSTEYTKLSWHAGVRLGYQHPLGFTARIGAHYTQTSWLFDYINTRDVRSIITLDTTFFPDTTIAHADTVTITGTRIKKTYNRFYTVDIPILIGYQVDHIDWQMGIHGGPVFNIAFEKKGDMLSPEVDLVSGLLIPKSFSAPTPDPDVYHPTYQSVLGLSLYGAGYIARRIGGRTYVYCEPHVHHRLKSLTLASYPVDERQTNFGLSVGLKVRL